MITKADINLPLFALQDAMNRKLARERARLQQLGQVKAAEELLAELPAIAPERLDLEERTRRIHELMAANVAAYERDTAEADEKARALAGFIRRGLAHSGDVVARLDAATDSRAIMQIGYLVREMLPEAGEGAR